MASSFTQHESGTQVTTATTEHVLQTTSPNTTAGEFQFLVDANALTAGTTLKIRVKEKVIAAGTIRTIVRDLITGVLAADDYGWVSPPLFLVNGWDFTIECSASSISIPWSIRKKADAGVTIATGGIAAASFASGAIDAAAIAADAITSSELAQSAAQEIADEVLDRNLAGGGSGNTRNVRNSLRAIRNKVSEAAGTLTITQEDDTTPAWTASVTRTGGTNPITAVDPT